MASSFKFEMDILQCTICEKRLSKPKVLPCLHSFCESCLKGFISDTTKEHPDEKETGSFKCPSCRSLVKLPAQRLPVSAWLPLLPSSTLLINLMEKMALVDAKVCDPCQRGNEDGIAASWCYDCGEALCERCTLYHKRMKLLMEHTVLSLTDIRAKSPKAAGIEDLCRIHAGKMIEAFCYDHDQVCCVDCVTYDHRKCKKVQSLEEAAPDVKLNNIVQSLSDRLKWVNEKAMSVIENRARNIEELHQKQTGILTDIVLLRQEIGQHLDKLEEKLKEEFTITHQALVEELKIETRNFEDLHRSVDNGHKVLSASELYATDEHLFVTAYKLRKLCEDHEEYIKEHSGKIYNFDYDLIINKVVDNFCQDAPTIGKINIQRSHTNILPAYMKDMRLESVVSLNGKLAKDAGHAWFTGGQFLADGRLILADYKNKRVKLFDISTGVLVSDITLLAKPWGIVEIRPGELLVTAPEEKVMFLISVDNEGAMFLQNEAMDVGTNCFGIQFHEDILYVASSNEIRLLNLEGDLLSTLSTEDKGVRYVFVNENNDVTYSTKTSLVSCSSAGKVLFRYTDPDLRSPRGLACDNEGNFYLCGMDSNNVHQVSSTGSLHRLLMTGRDGIKNPYFIGFERNTTRLFLTQMDCDTVLVYNLITDW